MQQYEYRNAKFAVEQAQNWVGQLVEAKAAGDKLTTAEAVLEKAKAHLERLLIKANPAEREAMVGNNLLLMYADVTDVERAKLEELDASVSTLTFATSDRLSIPIWISGERDGCRVVRLIRSGQEVSTLFEIPSTELLELPTSMIYLLIARQMVRP